jgi:hypothetical protein
MSMAGVHSTHVPVASSQIGFFGFAAQSHPAPPVPPAPPALALDDDEVEDDTELVTPVCCPPAPVAAGCSSDDAQEAAMTVSAEAASQMVSQPPEWPARGW